MISVIAAAFAVLSPILFVIALLAVATWRQRWQEAEVARQIRLTDAIAAEMGAIVAPVVSRSFGGPWRVAIQVPFGRPLVVAQVVKIVHDTLARIDGGRYELVLTSAAPSTRAIQPSAGVRRLRAA
jgi:hypothetical protein